jgi:hypothetical protein
MQEQPHRREQGGETNIIKGKYWAGSYQVQVLRRQYNFKTAIYQRFAILLSQSPQLPIETSISPPVISLHILGFWISTHILLLGVAVHPQ